MTQVGARKRLLVSPDLLASEVDFVEPVLSQILSSFSHSDKCELLCPKNERNENAEKFIQTEVTRRRVKLFEIASGTGQHVAELALSFPAVDFFPSDVHVDSYETTATPNIAPIRKFDIFNEVVIFLSLPRLPYPVLARTPSSYYETKHTSNAINRSVY